MRTSSSERGVLYARNTAAFMLDLLPAFSRISPAACTRTSTGRGAAPGSQGRGLTGRSGSRYKPRSPGRARPRSRLAKATRNGLASGSDGATRCFWCAGDPLYEAYHDREWGFPQRDDVRLFEKICLEGFQAGLAWITVLRKRDAFRRAFHGFEPAR